MTENKKRLDHYDVAELVDAAHAEGKSPDLSGLDLRELDLTSFNLGGAHLREANLRGADLRYADLRGVYWDGLQITDLPSGQLILTPTCDGWKLRVGCWRGTPDQLRALIAQDEGWPEAKGEEVTRRRPYLQAALALCEAHMKDHADVIDNLKERWSNE